MSQSFIHIPIPTELFVRLSDFLRKEGSDSDPVDTIRVAIEYWMDNASWKQEALLPGVFDQEKGYRWKQVFLPHGSLIRMKYKNRFYYAKVEGDVITYDNKSVSPSELANAITGTSRNAWRDMEIKRPNDAEWFLADFIRSQSEQKASIRNLTSTARSGRKKPMSWHRMVEIALKNLGGKAHLSNIYEEVSRICIAHGKNIPKTLKQTVQGTLEVNSSDSESHKGVRDIFYMAERKGAGVWALRKRQQK